MNYRVQDAKEWARETLDGFIVCPTTPFHEDFSLDEEGMRANVRHLLELESSTGLYVNSVFAEYYSLTIAERKRLAEVVVEEAAGRGPVLVEVTTESHTDAIDLARHAQECGADAIMVGAPLTGLRTRAGVLASIRAIADATEIGIGVFTTTWADVGFHIDGDMLLELSALDAICVVKDATGGMLDAYDMFARVEPRLHVSRPSLQYWLALRHVMGGDLVSPLWLGTVSPIYGDHITKRFDEAVRAENWSEATEAMLAIARLSAGISKNHAGGHHDVALVKAVTQLCGMAAGPVRPPLTSPPSGELETVRALLARAGTLGTPVTG